MKEDRLIFIISQPRSGSTYLQNLLSNNPVTNTCSEPWILLNFINLINPDLIQAKFDNKLAIKAFNNYKNNFKNFDFNEIQKKFLLELYSPLSEGYQFVIDKTPRYWEIIEEIRQLFPQSKIILLKRHPVEVAKSMMRTWDLKNLNDLLPYKRDLIIAPYVIANCERKFRNEANFYSLTYESLIENLLVETKKLYNWLGIPFKTEFIETTGNYKFKGEFGDPYQNSEKGYREIQRIKEQFIFSPFQDRFLRGYIYFLGKEFLTNYGYPSMDELKAKKTNTFLRYLHFPGEIRTFGAFRENLNKLMKNLFYRTLEDNS